MEDRTGGECAAGAVLPKDIVLKKWKQVANALVVLAQKKSVAVTGNPENDAAPLISALAQGKAVSDAVVKALNGLNKLQLAARADNDGKKIDAKTAKSFTALADKVVTLLR